MLGITGGVNPTSLIGSSVMYQMCWWFGTLGVNYLLYYEGKGLSDIIDESDFGKRITIKMYDGLY